MKNISFKNVNYTKKDYPWSHLKIGKDIVIGKKLSEIGDNEKISLLNDLMFKTMFTDSRRIKFSAKLLSLAFQNVSFDEVMNNLRLLSPVLDKNMVGSKGMEGDYVAELFGYVISIETNNTDQTERNINYLDILESTNISVGSKYKYPRGSF